ncbi:MULTISPECIES: PadR family transcriptional regulator [unclassified Mesorhizobium]|jgi:DNA-binding PadR family transcriptional regulator|uniref:PadR family transcriptional regulator n=1 Tax=unclassified Mesorhizobium TaxID=325217 RepID=UPI0003CE1A6D|nr:MULTISPECIES: PadR family transcriptional regulator [unclassified Mesorhizobium]ESW75402.1 PadR family transcriptional regulator [Mesorhizobium sp. LSJC285A00]ESX09898.1 PadR family transcriptional regulator [Mesorhizobium sp. LSJC265A00]ESX16437.1 PadR family transcriptional regulator [Mesorhizobium sp. LSJC255A00]ESX32321.1 PadR family transcriptional regulator [Mesorhizobium sp. LSHC440B00]ESX38962.1 PadR family transcriptional regulator [Mesorhizobium sp. LSHC432A00]
MHRHHPFGERAERAFLHMAGKFGGRGGGGFGPFGHGGRGGGRGGPGDMFRAGRMLADGDLKLITLSLLAEAPRHGYDIIKALEERTSGIYSPSPGVVYPTLTFLEEAGYAASAADGNKKVFSITEAGQAHLAENREMIDGVLEHLERFGRKMAKARDWFGWNDDGEEGGRRGGRGRSEARDEFRAVRHRLRAALGDLVDAPAEKQAEAIAVLEAAAEALEALSRG